MFLQAYTLYLDGEAKDKMYSINLHNIFVQFDFKEIVLPLVNGLTNFLISFNNVLNVNESMANVLPKKYWLNVTRFGLLCAEVFSLENELGHNVIVV